MTNGFGSHLYNSPIYTLCNNTAEFYRQRGEILDANSKEAECDREYFGGRSAPTSDLWFEAAFATLVACGLLYLFLRGVIFLAQWVWRGREISS